MQNSHNQIKPRVHKPPAHLFHATVLHSDSSTYIVTVAPHNEYSMPTMEAIPLANVFSGFLGFKESNMPSPGTQVLCFTANVNLAIILGCIPQSDPPVPFAKRTVVGAGNGPNEAKNIQGILNLLGTQLFNNNRPTDTSPQDYVVSNEFGILLGLFSQFATLKASDLAQVQVHFMDDLVRILSHNFEHFSALGELKIYHDGKSLGFEWGGTHLPNEGLGIPQLNTVDNTPTVNNIGTANLDDTQDFYTQKQEQLKATERLRIFFGRLSELLDIFIIKPSGPTILNGVNPTVPETGLSQIKYNLDGGIYIRSIKEVFVEKTNWIRVPTRTTVIEDPTGADGTTTNYELKTNFIFDDTFQDKTQNPFLYFLQLRDYAAYLQDYENYIGYEVEDANGKSDLYVNPDFTNEEVITGITKVDPLTPVTYISRKSGIYLMSNGGLLFKDGFGSGIVMEGGNIYMQPAKDLVMQPMQNLVGKIGQNVAIAAQNQIDLSSTTGGMRVKTSLAQQYYSDASGIILQSNGNQVTEGMQAAGSETIEQIGGIVLQSKTGVYSFASNTSIISSTNSLFKAQNTYIQSNQDYTITGISGLVGAVSYLALESNSAIGIIAKSSITANAIGGNASFAGSSGTSIGLINQTIGITAPINGATYAVTGFGTISGILNSSSISQDYQLTINPIYQTQAAVTGLKFYFPSSSIYNLNVNGTDLIPQTITQQEDIAFNNWQLTTWGETAVNNTLPYPGADSFSNFYATGTLTNEVFDNDVIHTGFTSRLTNISGLSSSLTTLQNYKALGGPDA